MPREAIISPIRDPEDGRTTGYVVDIYDKLTSEFLAGFRADTHRRAHDLAELYDVAEEDIQVLTG